MTTIHPDDMDLSAGTYVKGIRLDENTFLARTEFQQLRVVTRDPDMLQPNSKRGADDPDILGEREIHALIQRALSGNKKSNVPNYQKYIENVVTSAKPGVLPPMHLWSEQKLEVFPVGSTIYLLIPNGDHLLAIDGETQLTAHHALGRADSVNPDVKMAHRRWPLAAIVHHGVSTADARQYFHDLNVLSVRPNVSLGLGMNTQDPIMGIVDDVTASSDVLRTRVERLARQLPRKSDKVVTLTNLRQMVITIAKGISGIQFGARPMPADDVDLAELRAVAKTWIPDYFAAFTPDVMSRETSLAGAGPVLAAVGAMGNRLLVTPAEDRPAVRAALLDELRVVDWSKGERWNGIAGGYTASGVFSVKGTKEVAYGVYNALTDIRSAAYAQIRGSSTRPIGPSPHNAETGPSTTSGPKTDARLVDQVANLPWDDDAQDA